MLGAISRVAIISALMLAHSAIAQAQTIPAGLIPEDVLKGAGTQTPEGRRAVQQFLTGDRPMPQVLAARAALAIKSLSSSGLYSDPAEMLAAADNIAAVAQPALCPARVMHAFVPNDFTLPPGAHGFDFGPADSDVMPGFDPVLPNDERVVGSGMRGLHRPGDNRLLSDGIIGMRNFSTPMENGLHRILLITEDTGEDSTLLSPLGNRIVVNGKAVELGDHPSGEWLREAVLNNPEAPATITDTGVNGVPFDAQRAGALMVEVEITNGRLEIQMQQPAGIGGRASYLVGAIAAPIAQGDVIGRYFDASQAVLDTDECLALEEEIQDALAELVEEIEPAAGPQEAEDLPEAVFEDGEAASPA
jgi:hypothetical protein